MVDFKRLQQIPVEKVCAQLGVVLKPKWGTHLRSPCPVCNNQRKRIFVVTPKLRLWHCFSCKKGGDALELVHLAKRIPKTEAADWLVEHFGLPP